MASSFLPYPILLQNEDTIGGIVAALGCVIWIIALLFMVLLFASMWKIYTKANKPGWAAIIPIYNAFVLTEITGRPTWWLVLYCLCGPISFIIASYDLGKSFGKSVGYIIGMILLWPIFYPMLAFGSAKYVGPVSQTS